MDLPEIKTGLEAVKQGLILNTQARQLLQEEFDRQVGNYRAYLENQISDDFDVSLSRKLDSLNVILGG